MRKPNEILDRPYRDNGAYRVPKEYFNTLGQHIMDSVDAAEKAKASTVATPLKHNFRIVPRIRYAAAACLTALMMGLGTLAYFAYDNNNSVTTAENESIQSAMSDDYVKECMDYAMLDNNDVYMYVASQQQ